MVIGRRLKMLEIVKKLKKKRCTNTRMMTEVIVRCLNCGQESIILHQNAVKNNRLGRKYCGLCIKDTFHNMTGTKFWGVWHGIRYRTKDKTDKNYGGRGIVVCEEWEDFMNFYNDMYQGYSEGLTIE